MLKNKREFCIKKTFYRSFRRAIYQYSKSEHSCGKSVILHLVGLDVLYYELMEPHSFVVPFL